MLEKVIKKKKKQTKQNKKFFFNQLIVDSHFSPEFIMLKEFLIAKKKVLRVPFYVIFRICQNRVTGEQYALKCLQDRPKSRSEV